jgi:hypothetical protein
MSEPMTLEPCPFCGATDVEAYPADRERSCWNVCCGNPGCVTRGDNDYLTEGDAVAAWNRRAHISQPAQAVDVDEAMVERMARVVAQHAGEDFDDIGSFARSVLMDTQRAALTAALKDSR